MLFPDGDDEDTGSVIEFSPPVDTSKLETPTQRNSGAPQISLMDDEVSISPSSPEMKSNLESSACGDLSGAPLTPRDEVIRPRSELGFNTPAHLRVIKGMQRTMDAGRAMKDAPKQPTIETPRPGEITSTPAVNFAGTFEPNSIVDVSSPGRTEEGRCPERTSVSSLQEVETRFLALPTINTSSVRETDLIQRPVRRISRRKFNRSQWLNKAVDSPTTPTDPMSRLFLNPVNQRQDFLPKATSFPEDFVHSEEGASLHKQCYTFDEIHQTTANDRSTSEFEHTSLLPLLEAPACGPLLNSEMPSVVPDPSQNDSSSVYSTGSTHYSEEKKECDVGHLDRAANPPGKEEKKVPQTPPSQSRDSIPQSPSSSHDASDDDEDDDQVEKNEGKVEEEDQKRQCAPPVDPGSPAPQDEDSRDPQQSADLEHFSQKETDINTECTFPVHKRNGTWGGVISLNDEGGATQFPSLMKSYSAPDGESNREGSFALTSSANSTQSDPNGTTGNIAHPPTMHKRTGTWDGVLSTDIYAVKAVNSLINSTSAVVNDAAVFLTDITRGDSSDADTASVHEACSLSGDRRSSDQHRNHPLCHSDNNFKAAVQGVLSHLSLSPRKPELQDRAFFLPEAENKEFLRNYFYCTKKDENDMAKEAENSKYENVDPTATNASSATAFGDGVGCAEPCNSRDTHCHMFAVDAMCGGFTYLFPVNAERAAAMNQSNNSHGTSDAVAPLLARSRTRSASFSREFYPSTHAGIDWQNHQKESWLGMFQRVASKRFSFHTESDFERSKHPFTPPCLTRRVLTRNQSR